VHRGSRTEWREFIRLAVDKGYYFDIPGADYQIEKIPSKDRDGFVAMEYKHFLEYLVAEHGIDKIAEYTREMVKDPGLARPLFHRVFGVYLQHATDSFKHSVFSQDRSDRD
jgi:hypothetical protein